MAIVRWDPFRDLVSMQDRLNHLLAGAPTRWSADEGYGAWIPPVDIFERGDTLVISVELPGVGSSDIDVRVENGVLTLQGQRRRSEEVDDKNAYRLERIFGTFSRSFTLPTTVDATKINARYKDGVLEVQLPKAEEAKPKKVQIQVG
jgi:HSP20 family protein